MPIDDSDPLFDFAREALVAAADLQHAVTDAKAVDVLTLWAEHRDAIFVCLGVAYGVACDRRWELATAAAAAADLARLEAEALKGAPGAWATVCRDREGGDP
jgi:hypothetical protein